MNASRQLVVYDRSRRRDPTGVRGTRFMTRPSMTAVATSTSGASLAVDGVTTVDSLVADSVEADLVLAQSLTTAISCRRPACPTALRNNAVGTVCDTWRPRRFVAQGS